MLKNIHPYFFVFGNEQSFHMSVSSYHQVGSWYWQTDGLEIYSTSTMGNAFFHFSDDVLKIYYSHVRVRNIVVWKNENGSVVQWGWSPRTINNTVVDGVDITHSRFGILISNSIIALSIQLHIMPIWRQQIQPIQIS